MRRRLLFAACSLLAVLLTLGIIEGNGHLAIWLLPFLSVGALIGAFVPAIALSTNRNRVITPDIAGDDLAMAVAAQWRHELWQRMNDSQLLSVPWVRSDTQIADRLVGVTPSDARISLPVGGGSENIADLFLSLPSRRLVLIGSPGSGKTIAAIELALQLLERRQLGEPVPVVVQMTSWDPRRRSYYGWLMDQLTMQYPFLAKLTASGQSAAEVLVRSGKIIPILDGFDESPQMFHPLMLEQLNRSLTAADGFVLTSRRDEYVNALVETAGVLNRAAVVELEPLSPTTIKDRLLAISDTPAINRVLQLLETSEQSNPLRQVLSSPLMLNLVGTTYSNRSKELEELLDRTRFPNAHSIQAHLLQSMVADATYRSDLRPGHYLPVNRDPAETYRWLSFLAALMARSGRQELAWWELDGATPAWVDSTAGAFLVSVGIGAIVLVRHGLGPGAIAAIVSAISVSIFGAMISRRDHYKLWVAGFPSRRREVIFRALFIGFIATVPLAVIATKVAGWVLGIIAGTVLWVAISALAWLAGGIREQDSATPNVTLRASRLLATSTWIALGVSVAVVWLLIARRLNSDGVTVGLVAAIASLILLIPGSAWGRFTVARIWFAVQGKLPWRFLTFIKEMQSAGLLRQNGSAYQFRHAILGDVLIDGSWRDWPELAPRSTEL